MAATRGTTQEISYQARVQKKVITMLQQNVLILVFVLTLKNICKKILKQANFFLNLRKLVGST